MKSYDEVFIEEEIKEKRAKSFLLIGFPLIFLSIVLAIFSETEFYSDEEIYGNVKLEKFQIYTIKLTKDFPLGYSYVYGGNLSIKTTNFVNLVIINGISKRISIEDEKEINMEKNWNIIRISSLNNNTKVDYSIKYILVNKPYLFVSYFAFFLLILGFILGFTGLFLRIISKYHKRWKEKEKF